MMGRKNKTYTNYIHSRLSRYSLCHPQLSGARARARARRFSTISSLPFYGGLCVFVYVFLSFPVIYPDFALGTACVRRMGR